MLAYVFWHRPAAGTEGAAYEARMLDFHAALTADPPDGFHGGSTHRLDELPWLPGDGPAYEDVYRVADWVALGALETGAVSGSRSGAHDAAAHASGAGAGAVYRHRDGSDDAEGAVASWGARSGEGVWLRALVLGPAPEWVAFGSRPVPDGPGPVLRRTRLAR